jgi:hypothetical protein
MAILARMTIPGMDAATYDQVSAQLTAVIKAAPGFITHVAYPSPGGFSVGEIWASRGDYESFFNENVKPNVPVEIRQEVIELHAVIQP